MTDLSTLLSRVESGSGADREIDILIATTLGGFVLEKRDRDRKAWLYPTSEREFRRDPDYGGWSEGYRYTTDLNAVVALVEAKLPGHAAAVGTMKFDPPGTPWGCIWSPQGSVFAQATAPTPARALLAALIRAEMEKVK